MCIVLRVGYECEQYSNSVRWWRMISYGSASLQGWGMVDRARCEYGREPLAEGRPRCEELGNGCRPRCDDLRIMWVVLDLAIPMVCYGVCIYSVCVGVEYFNYACRHLPFPNFFLQYFCGKPCLTVQKMLRPLKSAQPWASYSLF